MIDFHAHILPNLDDGSKSIEETFALIEEAKKVGFEGIISTSHYMEDYYESNKSEKITWINAINNIAKEKNLNIHIYLGNEIYISSNMIELLKTEKACTINDTSYVLFELPFNTKPINLYDVIYDLLEYKLVPILAHIERYTFVQKDPQIVYDLIEKGVLIQSNYGSFIGQYGDKAQIIAKRFLESDIVHFLGTDVHKQNTIYPQIPQILKELEKIIGKDKLEKITKINPRLVLDNKNISIEEPKPIELSFKEKLILRKKYT